MNRAASHTPLTLPPLVAACMGRLPAYPGAWILARALNAALAPELPADTRTALEGQRLRLRIADMGVAFDFGWRRDRFVAFGTEGASALEIGATLHDLWLLARREVDPDTLFFSRRLRLEGDTALGLLVKNTLDGLDHSTLELLARCLRRAPARRAAGE